MARIAAYISYDGTRYSGWQRQDSAKQNFNTIQYIVEKALSKIADFQVYSVCAGRTDAGVHALMQVIHFDAPVDRGAEAWVFGANSVLPKDIRIHWACRVADDFHARFSALDREYTYLIINSPVYCAINLNRFFMVKKNIDIEKMQNACSYLVGAHDFHGFRASGCQAKNSVREVFDCALSKLDNYSNIIKFTIRANAFLYRMVRRIVGALLAIGKGVKNLDWFIKVLNREYEPSVFTVPAHGLYLSRVSYNKEFNFPSFLNLSYLII